MLDGRQIARATGLDTGSQPIGYVAVGNLYTPASTTTTGHIYFDDVQTSTPVS